MSTAIVWSKDNCPYCVAAKALLTEMGIPFEERNIQGDKWTKPMLLEVVPRATTVPQIFIDGSLIGGHTELVSYNKAKQSLTEQSPQLNSTTLQEKR